MHMVTGGFEQEKKGGKKKRYTLTTSFQIITKALTKLRPISGAGRWRLAWFLLFCQSEGRWFKSGA